MSTPAPPDYPPPIFDLLEEESPTAARRQLEVFDFTSAVAPRPVQDASMAEACESGLWLRHQFLDESHQVSQQIDTPTGSYWHGIMHRREGDFGNAKYWFRRVGPHPVFSELAAAAHQIAPQVFSDSTPWDPFDFVDRCQAAARGPASDSVLQAVESAEWDLLFAFCFRQALDVE